MTDRTITLNKVFSEDSIGLISGFWFCMAAISAYLSFTKLWSSIDDAEAGTL